MDKNIFLFLKNDSYRELEVHCNNLCMVKDKQLKRLNFNKYFLVVYLNKSLYYKDFLPNEYIVRYRTGFDIYKNKLKSNILNVCELIKNINDCYYKINTHINVKGNYITYINFIKSTNQLFNLNISISNCKILCKNEIILNELNSGLGVLTWKQNLGNQIIHNYHENYYWNDEIKLIYLNYTIKNTDNLCEFYDYNSVPKILELENKFTYIQ